MKKICLAFLMVLVMSFGVWGVSIPFKEPSPIQCDGSNDCTTKGDLTVNGNLYSSNVANYSRYAQVSYIKGKLTACKLLLVWDGTAGAEVNQCNATSVAGLTTNVSTPLAQGMTYVADYDGSDDCDVIADNADLETGDNTNDYDFTVGMWIKFNTLTASRTLFGKWDGALTTDEWRMMTSAGSKFQFVISDDTGGTASIVNASNTLTTGTWYFVVYRADNADGAGALLSAELDIFFNGTKDAAPTRSIGTSGATSGDTMPVTVGCRYNTYPAMDQYQDITVGGVFFTREAVSDANITAIYDATRGYYQ